MALKSGEDIVVESAVRLHRRQLLQMLAAGTALALVPGVTAGPAHAQETPARGGVLRVSAPFNPSSLDPVTSGAGSDHMILYSLYDTLVDFEPATLQPRPGLSTEWKFETPTRLVMTLREGVKFHDGTDFDAEAVKANLDRALNHPRSTAKGDLASVKSVEVIDSHRVAINTDRPDTALPLILADRPGMMVSPTAFNEAPERFIDRTPVGTGPFSFVRWNDGDVVEMKRFDGYWEDGIPYLDGIVFRIITDLNTGLRSVIAGESDFVYRLNPQQKLVADRMGDRVVVRSSPTIANYHIVFNYAKAPLNDERVRQAINYAVDRDAFNKAALLGLGTVAQTMLPPGYWAHDSSLDGFYKLDRDKARALLAEAGYPDGFELKYYSNADQSSQQRAEVIMEQLRQVGIRCVLTTGSNADMFQRFMVQGEGDAMMVNWTGRPDPVQCFLFIYGEQGANNAGKVPPPKDLADAIAAAQAGVTQDERKPAFARAERAALEHALSCEVAFVPGIEVHGKNVGGYEPSLLGKPKFNRLFLKA
jgi:peptide/nickel transport system permease protein/peptide/nickel transport system substrate-binding protein